MSLGRLSQQAGVELTRTTTIGDPIATTAPISTRSPVRSDVAQALMGGGAIVTRVQLRPTTARCSAG